MRKPRRRWPLVGDRRRRLRRLQQLEQRVASEERRHLPDRHELAHRLAEPVRRLQPGRLLDLRVHLSLPWSSTTRRTSTSRPTSRSRGRRRRTARPGRSRRVPNAKWSDGQPLTAEDAAWTINTDIKYKSTGAANTAGLIAHIKSADAPDPTRSSSTTRRRVGTCSRSSSSSRSCRSTSGAAHRPQGHRPEDVPERRARSSAPGPFILTKYKKDQIALFQRNDASTGRSRRSTASGCRCSRTTTRSSRR